MTLTLSGPASHPVQLTSGLYVAVLTPGILLLPVWPLPLSLATTRGISFDFSSSGYLDVSVPRVPRVNLCIQLTLRDSSSRGFPHSDIRGSKLIYSSPRLFAVNRVLHRLLMPRHSPYALFRLNFLSLRYPSGHRSLARSLSELLEFQNFGFHITRIKKVFLFSCLFVLPLGKTVV